jgi:hypothetical protein
MSFDKKLLAATTAASDNPHSIINYRHAHTFVDEHVGNKT